MRFTGDGSRRLGSAAPVIDRRLGVLARPSRLRRGMGHLLLAAGLLVSAGACGTSGCSNPPVEILNMGTAAVAAADPCTGQSQNHIVDWYTRQGIRYPLRCGKTNPAGWGYLHILRDDSGHGDALNDRSFATEIAYTLKHGVEGFAGGGNYRYTHEYTDAGKACTNAWGFRVVLAKEPLLSDGHPAGIITALRYSSRPTLYP